MSYDQRVRGAALQRERLSALLQDQRALDAQIQQLANTIETLRRQLDAEERMGRSHARTRIR